MKALLVLVSLLVAGCVAAGWTRPNTTEAQMRRLADSKGKAAGALFLAMMSRHHLGGVDMARYAAEHGKDHIMTSLAASMARNQATEINEYSQTRRRLGLPVPSGYTDPP